MRSGAVVLYLGVLVLCGFAIVLADSRLRALQFEQAGVQMPSFRVDVQRLPRV